MQFIIPLALLVLFGILALGALRWWGQRADRAEWRRLAAPDSFVWALRTRGLDPGGPVARARGHMLGTDDYFPFFLADVTEIRFPGATS